MILTVDQVIQDIIEVEADRLMKEFQPDAAHVIVLKPSTGEILGLTNRPTFDPNRRETMESANLNCVLIVMNSSGLGEGVKVTPYTLA